MHSPAAVALPPRLPAFLRLNMPPADSLRWILRMGNLGPGIAPLPVEKERVMPIRGSPDGACHPRPQSGRDRPEWVVAINRNAWSRSIGTAGRDHPVRAPGSWDGLAASAGKR